MPKTKYLVKIMKFLRNFVNFLWLYLLKKMLLDVVFLNTRDYKVWIKCKAE